VWAFHRANVNVTHASYGNMSDFAAARQSPTIPMGKEDSLVPSVRPPHAPFYCARCNSLSVSAS
jgi:hypothetical protein